MAKVIKFQAPFERLKFTGYSADTILRRAIILQAVIDASNISNNREVKKLEIEAKEWIFGKSEFFIHFCEEAGMEPDFVINITKQVIELQSGKTSKDQNARRKKEKMVS